MKKLLVRIATATMMMTLIAVVAWGLPPLTPHHCPYQCASFQNVATSPLAKKACSLFSLLTENLLKTHIL